jgi:VCBS repeat-containing protein
MDSGSAQPPAGAIIVRDAQLLFDGDFSQSGVDLILSKDGRELVLHDYFKGEKRAPLASPDGAYLSGDIVKTLTGDVHLSQAGGSPTAESHVIGHVTKLVGSATVMRNGVSIILTMGDNVEKGDVVQTSADSRLGITFIDGTVFGLSSNARMVLNEMVYDPNGSDNHSLLSLVSGTITFVAGDTAKHGDMKVDTPVATMGIRGTAVLVEIDFSVPGQNSAPNASFQVLVEPDGTTGSYVLFDKTTLQPIALLNQPGLQVNIYNGLISQSSNPLSEDALKLINDVYAQKFTENTKTTTAMTDSIVPPGLEGLVFKISNGVIVQPVFAEVTAQPSTLGSTSFLLLPHIGLPPTMVVSGGVLNGVGTSGISAIDTVSGSIAFADVNAGDHPTASVTFTSFSLEDAQHNAITSLTPQQLADISAVEASIVVVPAPGNNNNGSATWTYSIPDKDLAFLTPGETLTLTYTAEVQTNYAPDNETVFAPFTITISAATPTPPTIATTNASLIIPEANGATIDHAGGTITFTDADVSTHPTVSTKFASFEYQDASHNDITLTPALTAEIAAVEAALTLTPSPTNGNNGSVSWSYDIDAQDLNFIGAGDTLTLTYTATVNDGIGSTVSEPFHISITNDTPIIVSETDPAVQNVVALTETGTPIVLAEGTNTNSAGFPTETFDTQIAGSLSDNGAGTGNFFSTALDATFSASGDAGIVNGSLAGVTSAPFVGPVPGELDTTNYLSIGGGAAETITFAQMENSFGLYWGSVDSFNTIDFYNGTTLVASFSGSEISPLLASGGEGSFTSNGYVEFLGLAPFDKVVLASAEPSFEIDNISAGSIHAELAAPVTGTLTVSDVESGDPLTASVVGNATVELNGSTTLPSDANVSALIAANAITFDSVTSNGGTQVLDWAYNPTDPDLDFLQPGDTLTITYMAEVSNGHGTSAEQPLTITIAGTDPNANMSNFSFVSGTSGNETFNNVGNGVTIFSGGGQDTFNFNPGFGSATIANFNVATDTINIDHTLFPNVAAILASAAPANSGHDTTITDAAHDQITLTGVTVAQLQAHSSDFHLI